MTSKRKDEKMEEVKGKEANVLEAEIRRGEVERKEDKKCQLKKESKKGLSHESEKFGLHATLARIEEQRQYQERTELKQNNKEPEQ